MGGIYPTTESCYRNLPQVPLVRTFEAPYVNLICIRRNTMKLMVYSHDAFGLGNIRRMMAICQHLLKAIPNLSILLISGSPMMQSFRLPQGLDYIKLPCLNRGESGELSAKYLGTDLDATISLRSDIILAAVRNFKPDLFLVDKKPFGLRGELRNTLTYLNAVHPKTSLVLLLRDILDSPEITGREWREQGYYDAISTFYERVLVVGMREVFDISTEYDFPAEIAQRVNYCGYIRKEPGQKRRDTLRHELGLQPGEQLVLVTPGGGEDGFNLVKNYLLGSEQLPSSVHSLVITGPEMPIEHRKQLEHIAIAQNVRIQEFTDDLMSYIDAADTVVCMSGYNTVTEVLSQAKRSVTVPRTKPGQEQLIRAERMANLGLLQMVHPDQLTPEYLVQCVVSQLSSRNAAPISPRLDLNALPKIATLVASMLYGSEPESQPAAASYARTPAFAALG
jgi:predicted glycosyltransferase